MDHRQVQFVLQYRLLPFLCLVALFSTQLELLPELVEILIVRYICISTRVFLIGFISDYRYNNTDTYKSSLYDFYYENLFGAIRCASFEITKPHIKSAHNFYFQKLFDSMCLMSVTDMGDRFG